MKVQISPRGLADYQRRVPRPWHYCMAPVMLIVLCLPQDVPSILRDFWRLAQSQDSTGWARIASLPVPSGGGGRIERFVIDGSAIDQRTVRSIAMQDDSGALVVMMTTFNGYQYAEIALRFVHESAGGLSVAAIGRMRADVPVSTDESILDLNGSVLAEGAGPGVDYVWVRFQLSGLLSRDAGSVRPVFIEGLERVSLGGVEWVDLVHEPMVACSSGVVVAPATRLIENRWPGGHIKSAGLLDGNGHRAGVWTTWYESGALQSHCHYVDGVPNGVWQSFTVAGLPSELGRMEGGLRHGAWRAWMGLGDQSIASAGEYSAGKREGAWSEWWGNGKLKSYGAFEAGVMSGKWSFYWPSGHQEATGVYRNGYRAGVWTYWSESGVVRETKTEVEPPWAR